MIKKPLLSVIIPCYNSSKLMQKSFDFFKKNYREEVELIYIDDCSEDDTYSVLMNFAASSRYKISVYRNQKNCGPGISRNNGIKYAEGSFITFLDADDVFADNYYDIILPLLTDKIDCLIYDFYFLYKDGKKINYSGFFREMAEGWIDVKDAITFVRGATCGKIYRKEIITTGGIGFLPQNLGEDIPFTKCVISKCERIFYIKRALYFYLQHNESLVHDKKIIKCENLYNSFDYMKIHIGTKYPDEIEAIFLVELLPTVALLNLSLMDRDCWVKKQKQVEQLYPNYIHNKYLKKMSAQRRLLVWLCYFKCYYGLKVYQSLKALLRP